MGTRTNLFVFIITFWLFLAILSNAFDVTLTKTLVSDLQPDKDTNFFEDIFTKSFNVLERTPIIKYFVPLFKMMSFQYTDEIPIAVTILLDGIGIFTAYIVFTMIKT